MSEKFFKVKSGLITGDSATIGGNLNVDSNLVVSGTITGDGSGLSGVTSYVDSNFDSDFAAKTTSDLTEGTNLYYTTTRFDSDFGANSTSDLSEGTNLYYTTVRFDSDFGDNSTSDLSEGTNLYYTKVRTDSDIDAAFTAKSTSDLSEGTNLYYTTTRFDSDFSDNTTSDLTEGTNLYYTTVRHDSDFDARLSGGTGVSVSSGEVSIGQAVDSTDQVTFSSVTVDSATVNNYIDFTPIAHPSHQEGRVFYDSEHNTFNYQNDVSGINFELGNNEYIRVKNISGSTITKGTPVYFSGVSGQIPTVAPADASNVAKYNTSGLITEDILDSSEGYVTVSGIIRDIDTSTLTAGQRVFVSALSVGALQQPSPTYPNFPMCIGYVAVSDSSAGEIVVSQQNHSVPSFRVINDAHIGGDFTVGGDFQVLGSTSQVNINNLAVDNQFIYLQSGDQIGDTYTFTGSGKDDAFVGGYFEGTATTNYYVRIDGTGTPDTIEWSKDNFSTTEATGLSIVADTYIDLDNGFQIKFETSTGHTSGDVWNWSASPSNLDFGIVSHYSDSSAYSHAGVFRDNADGRFKFFDDYTPEVTTSVNTGHASYSDADVQFGTAYGALSGNATTATTLQTNRNFSITGDITAAAVAFNGSNSVTLTASIDTGVVTNAMLAGSIADTKLNTISTASKVSNSATTATDANTANAIVARDASGDFTAGTITATAFSGDGSALTGLPAGYDSTNFDSDFGTKTTDNLTEGATNVYYTSGRFDTDFSNKTTTNLTEGTNLYYTTTRFDSDFGANSTSDLSEGTNLYYTTTRFDSDFGANSTSDLSEGTNLYYTTTRFDSDFGANSTSDLSEGTNLYHTTARARSSISVTDAGGDGSLGYNSTSGVITYTGPSAAEARAHFSAGGDLSYDSATGAFSFSETYSTGSELLAALLTVDGAASGLDADLLDGEHGSHYRIDVYDAAGTLLN